jgi:hypothetical protein
MNVENSQSEYERNATQHSWLANLVAFIAWLFDAIAKLKRVTRNTKFKANWRDHFDGLRETEWHVAQMLAQGAGLILSGKILDDADYIQLPMPPDFGGLCPRIPFAMNQRFLKVAQFMRDPEKYIRRHAARIAKRCGIDLNNPLAAHGSTDAGLHPAAHHEPAGVSSHSNLKVALKLSSAQSVRPSKHERGLTTARGPPAHATPYSPIPHALAA